MKKILTIITLITMIAGIKYNNYINYKNELINKCGQTTYELMNIEAGIKSETQSFIYYVVNNK